MKKILEATTVRDLGVTADQKNQIKSLAKNSPRGGNAAVIAEETGLSRRKVMAVLEILKIKSYSPGSYSPLTA